MTERLVYKVRVNYKSGRTEEFKVFSFTYDKATNDIEWEAFCPSGKLPIMMGGPNIESIWQLSSEVVSFPDFSSEISSISQS